jgi:hypothetical protein
MVRCFGARLAVCGLVMLGGVAALPPVASSQPDARTASTSSISFSINQPAGSQAKVHFTGGISTIIEQTAAGNNMLAFVAASSPTNTGFAVLSGATVGGALASTTVIVVAQLVPSAAITGTATLPTGATMSASLNDGAPQQITNGGFSIAQPTTVGATRGPSLSASPGRVTAGGRVKVSGNVAGGCVRGDTVALLSRAFTDTYSFAGVPTIYATVGRQGAFSVKTTIPASRKAGSYKITGRCGGGSLGAVAHLRVLNR